MATFKGRVHIAGNILDVPRSDRNQIVKGIVKQMSPAARQALILKGAEVEAAEHRRAAGFTKKGVKYTPKKIQAIRNLAANGPANSRAYYAKIRAMIAAGKPTHRYVNGRPVPLKLEELTIIDNGGRISDAIMKPPRKVYEKTGKPQPPQLKNAAKKTYEEKVAKYGELSDFIRPSKQGMKKGIPAPEPVRYEQPRKERVVKGATTSVQSKRRRDEKAEIDIEEAEEFERRIAEMI